MGSIASINTPPAIGAALGLIAGCFMFISHPGLLCYAYDPYANGHMDVTWRSYAYQFKLSEACTVAPDQGFINVRIHRNDEIKSGDWYINTIDLFVRDWVIMTATLVMLRRNR